MEGRETQLAVFRENVAQTETRFLSYQDKTSSLREELRQTAGTDISSYIDYRRNWLQTAQRLLAALDAGLSEEQLEPAIEGTMASFAEMRFALDRITETEMNPLIQESREQMTARAIDARNQLLTTLIVALVLGGFFTISGSTAIRRQYLEMLRDRDTRESEAKLKEQERRIHDAFELVQSEGTAIQVVRGVLAELVEPTHQAELLLADTSHAHLRRETGTKDPESAEFSGCKVLKPAECPAIRRNSRLSFPTSETFDTCPYLKGRVPDGCSATCVPVNILGRTAGVVHAVGAKHDLLTGNRDAGIRALANSAGDVLGMLRAFATKDRQANTDSLTGLDNRRSLEAKLPEIMARGAYTVAFADLDKFKQLNDTHGHDMGDKALRLFADVLRGSVRPDDLVGRWGGEEFVIVLPGSTDEKAVRVVHRMRERLKEALAIGAVPNFTASFGLCDSRDAETFGDVINAADAALLRAKEEGRDRIIYGVIGEGDARVVEDLLATPPEDTGPYRRVSAA
jgi:diguanylate cyclase (GGDEF)-like protein